jgi:toxin ParE1/3/4
LTENAVLVLEWRETARADLLAIVDYISDDDPDAAQRLKDDIEAKAVKLTEHSKLYRVGRIAGTREMVVRTNYVVIYTEDARAVTILRVLHAAQQWPPVQEQNHAKTPVE